MDECLSLIKLLHLPQPKMQLWNRVELRVVSTVDFSKFETIGQASICSVQIINILRLDNQHLLGDILVTTLFWWHWWVTHFDDTLAEISLMTL